jgi:hypothetical protein
MRLKTRIKLWWDRLWIRKDEFHSSLDMNMEAMLEMTDKQREEYLNDLAKRRHIAHERDLGEIEVTQSDTLEKLFKKIEEKSKKKPSGFKSAIIEEKDYK